MKKFNLDQALKNQAETGDPGVVTRSGVKIRELHLFKKKGARCLYSLDDYEVVNGHFLNGAYQTDDESIHDLFMATKKVKKTVVIVRDKSTNYLFSLQRGTFNPSVYDRDYEFLKEVEVEVEE